MATPTAPSPTDLAQEIAELEIELDQAVRAAARAKLNSADHEAAFLSERLEAKKAELKAAEDAEAVSAALHQRQQQLDLLAQLESDISKAKAETNTLRAMIVELPGRLSRAQWQLDQLLRSHAQLKSELKG
jgi:chromosome segregation ATPase